MRKLALAVVVLAAACASSNDSKIASGPAPAGDPRIGELQTSMTELLERIDVLNDRIARLEQANEQRPTQQVVSAPTPSTSSASGGGPVLRSTPAAHPSTPAGTASRAVIDAQMAERYRNAIVLFGKNQLPDARKAFQQVFDADPTGELADNALFWIGETYYAAGNYGEAMRFYKRVADDYSDQNKAPDALFKLALAYEKTGDLMLARSTLQDVMKRYPYSSMASSAKAELNRIKY